MQTDDIEKIRGLAKEIYEKVTLIAQETTGEIWLWATGAKTHTDQLISLLPKPCSTCGGSGFMQTFDQASQTGNIELCPCQAPAGDEFVKTFRRWLKALGTTDITNNQVRVKGYQACNLLTEQAKQNAGLETGLHRAEEMLNEYRQQVAQLEGEKKGLEERYIEAVNDMAKLKRKSKNCVCPHCGFGFEQALQKGDE